MIYGDKKSFERVIRGIKKSADAISSTLGGKGTSVIIENEIDSPIITYDGVTVASHIDLKDRFEQIGVSLVKEVATKTNQEAGDGTGHRPQSDFHRISER